MKAAKVESIREARRRLGGRALRHLSCAHPLARAAATTSTFPARWRSRHRRHRHRLRAHRARPRRATTTTSGWPTQPEAAASAASTPTIPFTVDADGVLHQGRAGLRRQARAQREGRQGRRQRRRHQGAGRSRHAHRARPPEAPVPALLALEEAGHLPQHAAVVHRHGQAASKGVPKSGNQTPAPARARRRSSETEWVPAVGREPHPRHDRGPRPTGSSRASAPGACRSPCSATRRRTR